MFAVLSNDNASINSIQKVKIRLEIACWKHPNCYAICELQFF